MLSSYPFLAQATDAVRDQGFMQTFIMIGVAMLFFYFILWRPEQKRRKKLEQQRKNLKKGDKVTAMGIIGTVVKINDNTVVVAMIDGAKIEFLKHAVTDVHPAGGEVDTANSSSTS